MLRGETPLPARQHGERRAGFDVEAGGDDAGDDDADVEVGDLHDGSSGGAVWPAGKPRVSGRSRG